MSASKDLVSIPNIVLIVTGVYFAVVAGLQEGSTYTEIGAIICFIAAGLAFEKDLFITGPWRLGTAAFSIVLFLTQLGSDFTAAKAGPAVIASAVINGVLFVLVLGVLLWTAKDMTTREEIKEEAEEIENSKKKKKLTYEI